MAKSNAFMNWTGGTFTYGSTTINLIEIEDVQPQDTGEEKPLRTGADNYPHFTTVRNCAVRLQVTTADPWSIYQIPRGQIGTVTMILNDAENGTGSGAITIVLNNAQILSRPVQGRNNEYARVTATFVSASSDGQTSPLQVTQAA